MKMKIDGKNFFVLFREKGKERVRKKDFLTENSREKLWRNEIIKREFYCIVSPERFSLCFHYQLIVDFQWKSVNLDTQSSKEKSE